VFLDDALNCDVSVSNLYSFVLRPQIAGYEDPNIELGCESLRDESSNLTNDDGKTPWDECCFCGGGYMVPEDTLQRRNLRVLAEPKDLGAEQKMEASAAPL
jgi:hypothetical protein